jgi:hypothetical protein
MMHQVTVSAGCRGPGFGAHRERTISRLFREFLQVLRVQAKFLEDHVNPRRAFSRLVLSDCHTKLVSRCFRPSRPLRLPQTPIQQGAHLPPH